MAQAMKVKKGDLVQVLSGKDRGKQGRVIDARPTERRVIVENLNVVKRHTKPRPMRDANRMGGTTMMPGGVIDKPAPLAGLEGDGRLPVVQPADAGRPRVQGGQGQAREGARLPAARLRRGAGQVMQRSDTATRRIRAAAEGALR